MKQKIKVFLEVKIMNNNVKKEIVEFYNPLYTYDANSIIEAKKRFKYLREKRIINKTYNNDKEISKDEFNNNIWIINDGLHNYYLDFYINVENYKKLYQSIFGFSYTQFVLFFKTLIVNHVEKLVAASLRNLTSDIRNVINANYNNDSEKINIINTYIVKNFLEALPGDEPKKEKVLDAIAEKAIYDERRARTLSEYNSYFLFDEIIKDYWKQYALESTFIYYFPIYLWWELTTIIPLRPIEYLVTPEDCLKNIGGTWYITVRRTNQKGTKEKKKYSVSESFDKTEFPITNEIADNIKKYKELTKTYSKNANRLLLNENAYYDCINHNKYYRSERYTSYMFNSTLQSFYYNILNKMYNISISNNPDDNFLPEGKINYINCGDTRHLAIQNIVFNCDSIHMAMQLAGHDKIETTLHYAENFSNYVKCYTYQTYVKYTKNSVDYPTEKLSLNNTSCVQLSDGGMCYSKKIRDYDYSDCGLDCKKCYYYRPCGDVTRTKDDELYLNRLKDELEGLIRAIKNYSLSTQKNINKLFESINKTKSVCNQLQKYYFEKYGR